jgi:hypothetical protein
MTREPTGRRPGRASTLLVTGLVLAASSQSKPPAFEFDVASSCGPAGRVTFDQGYTGCSEDPSVDVLGAAEVGLPPWALDADYADKDPEVPFVMAGPVVLPGSAPATTVRRTCRVNPEVAGVRAFTCAGEVPEAACEGTLTLVPQPAAGAAP